MEGKQPVSGGIMEPQGNPILSDLGYRALIDLLPCYLSIQDRSLQILFTNQAFRKDFGDGTGRLCHLVYKGSPTPCHICPVQRAFNDKGIHLSEETVYLSSGKAGQMIVLATPIPDVSGNVVAVIEMSLNITTVREFEKELTFLGQSVAMLSHDIKNILEGLQGGAYVVDEGIKDKDMKLAGKGWEIVKKNIHEISAVVQNILYASKKRVPKREKVRPAELVKDVVVLFEEKARGLDIALIEKPNANLPEVSLDPQGIRRMLGNLILNALQACERDSLKEFHSIVVRTDLYDPGHFMFEVEDNGAGMDETTQSNLFEKFFSRKGSEGTGLGLMVVDQIVKAHGGRIEVLTAPEKGSTFRIIFRLR